MARVAVDRAMAAAERSDDQRLMASIAATMSVQLMMQGSCGAGADLALDAARYLEGATACWQPQDKAIRGALYLSAAQAAARAQQRDRGLVLRLLPDDRPGRGNRPPTSSTTSPTGCASPVCSRPST